MNTDLFKNNVLKTLLYYDMFSYPLNNEELFKFMPQNSITPGDFNGLVKKVSSEDEAPFAERDGYFYVKPNEHYISSRKEKEEPTKKMWRSAGLVTQVIKRFPFVRCVLITGSLSKNNSDNSSDLDFMVIAEKNRLWIARTMLMLFKKFFLFNSYKYFCINYYITVDALEIEEKNIFTATEVAYVKATYNTELMNEFISANKWIKDYFPNYILGDPYLHTPGCKVNNSRSVLQKISEFFIPGFIAKKLDAYLLGRTMKYWNKKYSYIDENERELMFKSTSKASKAHPRNMQKKILNTYNEKLKQFNL